MSPGPFPLVLRALTAINCVDPGTTLRGEQRLADDLGVDSLGMVRLVRFLSEHLHVTVKARDMGEENFGTVASLERYLTARTVEGGAP